MKYLKIFEEFDLNKKLNLREFVENYLAYLLDDYIKISYSSHSSGSGPVEVLLIDNKNGYGLLEWDKLKNHFIPFLYMLEREYSVTYIGFVINRGELPTEYSLSDIDSDSFKVKTLSTINISLKLNKI